MEHKTTSFLTGIECFAKRNGTHSTTDFEDPFCGRYSIGDILKEQLSNELDKRTKIANVLAARKRRGIDQFIWISETEQQLPGNQIILRSPDSLISEYPDSATETLDECLVNLAAGIRHPASPVHLERGAYWWLYAGNGVDAVYFLSSLRDQRLISYSGTLAEVGRENSHNVVTIQPEGWARIRELQLRPSGQRKQAFVAMWFNQEMEKFFNDGMRPAIEDDGTKCMRIDLKEHNNKICDEIIAEIRRSKYLVADFTGQRGGVYFEAGFAFGLGIPVIWTVRDDDVQNLHFDTRQYAHITYSTPEELRTKLLNRIRATIV